MGDWRIYVEDRPDMSFVDLGDVDITEEDAASVPVPLIVHNSTGHDVRDVIIGATGESVKFIQFARDDDDGLPGVWAAPGEQVIAHAGVVLKDDSFRVWTRAFATVDAEVGEITFGVRVRGTAIA